MVQVVRTEAQTGLTQALTGMVQAVFDMVLNLAYETMLVVADLAKQVSELVYLAAVRCLEQQKTCL